RQSRSPPVPGRRGSPAACARAELPARGPICRQETPARIDRWPSACPIDGSPDRRTNGFVPRPRPMGPRFCPIAAYGHLAPAPRMCLAYVEEPEGAGRTLASADAREVLLADEIADRVRKRQEQVSRSAPVAVAAPAQDSIGCAVVTRCITRGSNLDLPEGLI